MEVVEGDLTASEMAAIAEDYYYGRNGKTKDYAEAVKWFRKSAEQGNVDAQYNLGRMYNNGEGVKQDCFEAIKWFRKSAEKGNEKAKEALKKIGEKL